MRYKIIAFSSILLSLFILFFSAKNLNNQKNINIETLTGEYDSFDTEGFFNGEITTSNKLAEEDDNNKVLGVVSNEHKRIEVDLTNQRLYAFEGDNKVYDFLISSGKWGKTPTGTFHIWIKLRYTKMEGGSKAINTYYYLPNVPYVMFFENDEIPAYRGFGLHGTYWHSNFGHPMSHGCVNMKTDEAALIYNWTAPYLGDGKSGRATEENKGTEIIIYGVAPKN